MSAKSLQPNILAKTKKSNYCALSLKEKSRTFSVLAWAGQKLVMVGRCWSSPLMALLGSFSPVYFDVYFAPRHVVFVLAFLNERDSFWLKLHSIVADKLFTVHVLLASRERSSISLQTFSINVGNPIQLLETSFSFSPPPHSSRQPLD